MIPRLLRTLMPGGRHGAHQVLFFHRVLPSPDPLLPGDPDQAQFHSLIGSLKRHFSILPLEQALDMLDEGRLPPASLSISFDDGYADNVAHVLPVLQEHGVSATFFICTGYLDGGRMWNDTVIEALRRLPAGVLDLSELGLGRHRLEEQLVERAGVAGRLLAAIKHHPQAERQQLADAIGERARGLPEHLMMSRAQVRQLAEAGMGIGAHTVTHPILRTLSEEAARREMADSKASLEALLDAPVNLLAYPNGKRNRDYDEHHARMARELGFRAAFSTDAGVVRLDADRWQLPRFPLWDRTHHRFMLRMLMNRYGLVG